MSFSNDCEGTDRSQVGPTVNGHNNQGSWTLHVTMASADVNSFNILIEPVFDS